MMPDQAFGLAANRPKGSGVLLGLVCVSLAALGGWSPLAAADSLIPSGQAAPNFSLTALDGNQVELAELNGRVVLLLFGEMYNEHSLEACKTVEKILASPVISKLKISAYFVITQAGERADLLKEARSKDIRLPVLLDPTRQTFAAYRVIVLPSLLVLDPQGTVVLASSGYPLDFESMTADALAFAGGRFGEQEFRRRREAQTGGELSQEKIRAVHLASLGDQLAKRGSADLALDNYRKALDLDTNCIPARIGLGSVLLERKELEDAEAQYRFVLQIDAHSIEGALGLIRVQVLRGGSELEAAREGARELLRKSPQDPRVVYAAAVIEERSGEIDAALGHYKLAAELLLHGSSHSWSN